MCLVGGGGRRCRPSLTESVKLQQCSYIKQAGTWQYMHVARNAHHGLHQVDVRVKREKKKKDKEKGPSERRNIQKSEIKFSSLLINTKV